VRRELPGRRARIVLLGCLTLVAPSRSGGQTAWDPNALPYEGPPVWQEAAVAALNRHLPTDSGYWVLGPLDLGVDLPDTTDLVRTTLRIIAPDPAGFRAVTRRLWMPTGGVALEGLQPSDTLPHELPPGYSGRFVKGTIVGENVLVQVFTVQQHRWLQWAERVGVTEIREAATGPIARYSRAVASHLQALEEGQRRLDPPRAGEYGLDPTYDLYPQPPEPVVRSREGYLGLLARNRVFSLDDRVRDVVGFVPGPDLVAWLRAEAPQVLFPSKDGPVALQHRYRDYAVAGGRWRGFPNLVTAGTEGLVPGRYVYVVDRFGMIRVAPVSDAGSDVAPGSMTAALLAHGEPVRAAGLLTLVAGPDRRLRVGAGNIRSPEYFFSNLSLTLYEDVEQRSDRYVLALGHVLTALEAGRLPHEDILLMKY